MHIVRQDQANLPLATAGLENQCGASTTPTLPSGKVARLTPMLKAYTGAIRGLDRLAPGLTTQLLLKLFVRPRRRRGRDYRDNLPAGAQRLAIDYRSQSLTGWCWGRRGPTVLLVHGWEDHSGTMLKLVNPLRERGYRVLTLDAPGHGLSPAMDTHLIDTSDALAAVLEQSGGCSAIIAHSYGAAATALMLARLPQWMPQHLTLVSPMLDILQHLAIFAGIAGLSPDGWHRLQRRVGERLGQPLESISTLDAAVQLQTPGLIVHDRNDPLIPYAISARLAECWSSGELLATQGLGHRRILSCARVVDEILDRMDVNLSTSVSTTNYDLERRP